MEDKSKYSVFNLNQVHKELFTRYIKYVKTKENSFIREICSYVDDFSQEK